MTAVALALGLATPTAAAERAVRLDAAFVQLAQPTPWPGFDAASVPLAIWDDPATWFFRHPKPPDGCTPASGGCRVAGRHPALVANSSAKIAGTMTATLMVPPRWPQASNDSTRVLAAVAIHEAFHVFQRHRHPGWQANEVDLFTYPSESESLSARTGLEMEALRRAVAARDAKTAAQWARTALQERRARFASMPPAAVTFERANEWNEGLAQYVQNRVLRQATRSLGTPRIERQHEFPADGIRDRVYVSGEALAILLDRFAPGWQDSLEADDKQPLDRLLDAHVKSGGGGFTADERAAAQRTGAAAVARLQQTRAAAKQEFLARPGPRLVIETTGEPLWPSSFDPLNVRNLGGGEVLHTRMLELANGAAKIAVLDHSALSEAAGVHPLFEGVRRLTISGLAAAPVVQATDSTTVIRAAGVEVTARQPRLEHEGDVWRLVVGR